MPELNNSKRADLPDSAFAYIDSLGKRRLPINDEPHVRNALARFNQVAFENDEARQHARTRLLNAAKKYKIVPVGFITGQLKSERELGQSKRDGPALPTGVVTLMMTDIEASTRLVNELGQAYGKLLRDVRRVIKKIVATNDGHIVDIRADEAFAVFKSPSGALSSAIAIQLELATRPLTRKLVRIRVGLHTGRPTVSEANYIGIAVHAVARVCSAAHGGQIMISSQAQDALKDLVPDGVRFRNLGSHRLRGLPDSLTLLQVEAKGLGTKFPPPNLGAT